MKIVCNNIPRGLLYWSELSEKEKAEFDYLHENEANFNGFFRYKGNTYDCNEFIAITENIAPHPQREGWENFDGYHSNSFFSGVLIKYSSDFDSVIVATYFA